MQKDDSFNVPSSYGQGIFGYKDPSGPWNGSAYGYIIISNKNQTISLDQHWMWAFIGAKCNKQYTNSLQPIQSKSAFAVEVALESGGLYCVDNGNG